MIDVAVFRHLRREFYRFFILKSPLFYYHIFYYLDYFDLDTFLNYLRPTVIILNVLFVFLLLLFLLTTQNTCHMKNRLNFIPNSSYFFLGNNTHNTFHTFTSVDEFLHTETLKNKKKEMTKTINQWYRRAAVSERETDRFSRSLKRRASHDRNMTNRKKT